MTKPYSLIQADCIAAMRTMPGSSVDAIVTDPPYELGFMGKAWDKTGIANDVEMWRHALAVLKPGGHLLAFGGTRTYHRMVCAIEDAGFEVRDQIGWVYGSGFPKSLDVSKAIDKAAGAMRQVVGDNPNGRTTVRTSEAWARPWNGDDDAGAMKRTAPATDAARQWQGWGTALKPAWEPIVVARKPLVGTVAANVLQHGTGALNIDGCRVLSGDDIGRTRTTALGRMRDDAWQPKAMESESHALGRWPANIIHDGSEEVLAAFPAQSSVTGKRSSASRAATVVGTAWLNANHESAEYTDSGSPARFFYCAKASKRDRGEGNTHPTVKPTELMRYLCRLVTPPGGLVLDPFVGSGSTGKAAVLEGFRFVGIETEASHVAISHRRIAGALDDDGLSVGLEDDGLSLDIGDGLDL